MLPPSKFQFLAAVRNTWRNFLSLSMWARPPQGWWPSLCGPAAKPTAAQPTFPSQPTRSTPKPHKLHGSTPKLPEIPCLPATPTFLRFSLIFLRNSSIFEVSTPKLNFHAETKFPRRNCLHPWFREGRCSGMQATRCGRRWRQRCWR